MIIECKAGCGVLLLCCLLYLCVFGFVHVYTAGTGSPWKPPGTSVQVIHGTVRELHRHLNADRSSLAELNRPDWILKCSLHVGYFMVLKVFRKWDYFSVASYITYSSNVIASVFLLCSFSRLPLLNLQVEAHVQIPVFNFFACCRGSLR